VVNGDGTGDRLFAARVGVAAAEWRPGAGHVLAFAARGGVTVADADAGGTLWRAAGGMKPEQLAWSPDGRLLLVVERGRLRLIDARGRTRKQLDLPAGMVAQRAAFSPDGASIALMRLHTDGRLSDVRLLSVRGRSWHERAGAPVTGSFDGLQWSPDGRWLLLAWPDADQWLFVRPGRVMPVSGIARSFTSGAGPALFPALGGWCCSR
jgi:dipeptidyl aminopeptidase/acylaminoacyl peptidase